MDVQFDIGSSVKLTASEIPLRKSMKEWIGFVQEGYTPNNDWVLVEWPSCSSCGNPRLWLEHRVNIEPYTNLTK